MHVRQHVVLDAADLKRLAAGKPLTLTLDNTVIDLSLGEPAAIALHSRGHRDLVNHAPRPTALNKQRGDCPYCAKRDLLIASHVKNMHADKPVPYLGPGGVECPTCHRTFPGKQSLAIHDHVHKKTRGPGRPPKSGRSRARRRRRRVKGAKHEADGQALRLVRKAVLSALAHERVGSPESRPPGRMGEDRDPRVHDVRPRSRRATGAHRVDVTRRVVGLRAEAASARRGAGSRRSGGRRRRHELSSAITGRTGNVTRYEMRLHGGSRRARRRLHCLLRRGRAGPRPAPVMLVTEPEPERPPRRRPRRR